MYQEAGCHIARSTAGAIRYSPRGFGQDERVVPSFRVGLPHWATLALGYTGWAGRRLLLSECHLVSNVLFSQLLIVGLLIALLALRPSTKRARVLAVFVLVFAATLAAGWTFEDWRWSRSESELEALLPSRGDRPGYATSDTCQACHPGPHSTWHRSYHRTMTQVARPELVGGPFRGEVLPFDGKSYLLEREDGELVVRSWSQGADPDDARSQRVVMTTGSHHMQAYWLPDTERGGLTLLPFVFLFEQDRWVERRNVFLNPPGLETQASRWSVNCLPCHTTSGLPGFDPQTGTLSPQTSELGIACEACHGPAEQHVAANRNPLRRYFYHWSERPDPTIVNPARLDADRASQICGQCHSVSLLDDQRWATSGDEFRPGDDLLSSRVMVLPGENRDHPWLAKTLEDQPWFLDSRFWNDGVIRVSGREYNGLRSSPCFRGGEFSCLSCHSLHDGDPVDQLAPGRDGDQACVQCHGDLAEDLPAHTFHAAASSGSRCANCHMPHTTYGLLKGIRSHTVDSPLVATDLATGRPNACNLCHLDQTLAWTADHLEAWYGQPAPELDDDRRQVAAGVLWMLRGDASQRALAAWNLGRPETRAAISKGWQAPYLAHLLIDPYAVVRFIAQRSLHDLEGFEELDYDFQGSPQQAIRAREETIRRWYALDSRPPAMARSPVLLTEQGRLLGAEIARLAAQRDDRPLVLEE